MAAKTSKQARFKKWTRISSGFVALGCGIALAVLTWMHQTASQRIQEETIAEMTQQVAKAAEIIDQRVGAIEPLVEGLAAGLTNHRLDQFNVVDSMIRVYEHTPELFGIGVAYAPGMSLDGELYAPYYSRSDGSEPTLVRVEEYYDYTEFNERSRWFYNTMLEDTMWVEPMWGEASETILLQYGVPFYSRAGHSDPGQRAGVVFANYSREDLRELMSSLDLGKYDFAVLYSKEGRYIHHPREEIVRGGFNLFELIWSLGSPDLNSAAVRSLKGLPGHVDYHEPLTGTSNWVFFHPIESTEWVLGLVVNKEGNLEGANVKRHRLLAIVTLSLCAITALLIFLAITFRLPLDGYSLMSAVVSLLLVAGTGTIWIVADKYPSLKEEEKLRIISKPTMEKYLDDYFRYSEQNYGGKPMTVTTGVFLKSIEFLSGTNVKVTGYIWQKYIDGVHDSLDRGFVLPEADEFEFEEAYRERKGKEELIGWAFKASLRQFFDYSRYPVDRQDVWLRLWHTNFDRNVILVPDIDAYKPTINPKTKPGLERELVLSGWTMENSYFNYQAHTYNTNFGTESYTGMVDFPELYFHTEFRRKFLSPVVSKVIPVLVAAIILFALLITCTTKRLELTGFSVNSIVAGCAALFFVVVFEHISLRSNLESATIIYFEHYYFALYMLMILVMVDSMLFISRVKVFIVTFRENLIPKLLFWPVYLGLIFFITLLVFY